MKNLIRLKRVSWKSKNNVYLYKGNQLEKDFQDKIDIVLIAKGGKINTNVIIGEFIELDDIITQEDKKMKENILKIDKIKVSDFVGKAANKAIELGRKNYWKTIFIINN